MNKLTTVAEDFQDLYSRFNHCGSQVMATLVLAASIERAAERIAKSVDNLQINVKMKKPDWL